MTEATFKYYLGACRALESGDYRRGYEYGLRRHYYGPRFAEDARIAAMEQQGGDVAAGLADGLAGRAPRSLTAEAVERRAKVDGVWGVP